MAAYETTAHSLENILVMIGSFPEVQEKLYNEYVEFYVKKGRSLMGLDQECIAH